MSKFSNAGENAVINHLLRNTAITAPTLYAALHTADPGETGGNELSGGGYLRKATGTFDVAASRATANTNDIIFGSITAAVGTVTHVSLWDAVSGGNMWWYSSAVSSSMVTAAGIVPVIAAGALDVSLGGAISTYVANALLNLICRGTAFATPGTSVYVSLHTGAVGLTGANEVSGNAYARVQEATWDSPTDGATANTAETAMGTPTPSSWGTLTDGGIWDASTAGNFLMGGTLASSVLTEADVPVRFAAGELDVTVA